MASGLVLVFDAAGRRFGGLAFDGERAHRELLGDEHDRQSLADLARLAYQQPVVTDSPRRAAELLGRAGAEPAHIWDVLELAALLAPECPAPLSRAVEYFGIVVERTGLGGQAQRAFILFQLLEAMLGRTDTQTLLHATRLS